MENGRANDSGEARMELFYPEKIRGLELKPIWSGAVTMQNARRLVDSPVRRSIVKRLLAGESATWLIVRSGNPEGDQKARATMKAFVQAAPDTLRIPDGVIQRSVAEAGEGGGFVGDPDNVLRSDVPLQIAFSFIEIDRHDPEESVFLQMLLNVEDDLHEFSSEPLAFPVFGRGRVLEPLVGSGIELNNALDYAGYLCGACSCQVKDQNPGLDLLVAADWQAALEGSEVILDKVLPPLEGIGIVDATPLPAEETANPVNAEDSPRSSISFAGMLGVTLIAATLILAVGSFLVLRKKGS